MNIWVVQIGCMHCHSNGMNYRHVIVYMSLILVRYLTCIAQYIQSQASMCLDSRLDLHGQTNPIPRFSESILYIRRYLVCTNLVSLTSLVLVANDCPLLYRSLCLQCPPLNATCHTAYCMWCIHAHMQYIH